MSGSLAPCIWTVFSNTGVIVPGAKIYTYLAGTMTPATVYTNADLNPLTHAHPNPVVCDAYGRAVIYLDRLSYKFVVTDASGVTLYTVDPVAATHIGQQTAGLVMAYLFGDASSPITDTSYPSGSIYTTCHAGSALWRIDPSLIPAGTYILEIMGKVASGFNTLYCALVNLSDGSPNTPMVEVSTSNAVGVLVRSGAITFPSGGAEKNFALKVKVDSGSGYVWAARIVRTA